LAIVVVVLVAVAAPTFVGLVACPAAVVALDLALATVLLIDSHFVVVVLQSSGHQFVSHKVFGVDVVEIEGLVHRHETIFLFFSFSFFFC
jgi:uncharacterized protein (DUF362 family)